MKNLQIWGTGWAASWAFFKVIEKTQGMTNISFRIWSFVSAKSLSKRYKLKTKYDYVRDQHLQFPVAITNNGFG